MYTNNVDKYLEKIGLGGGRFGAVMLKGTDGNYGIVMDYACSTPLMAHEVAHVVLTLFADIRSSVDEGDQEPFAYLLQWILIRCLEFQKEVRGKFRARD